MSLARLVQAALSTPDGSKRTMRVGPLTLTIAHRGTRWGVRAVLTTRDGVTSATLTSDERVIRRIVARMAAAGLLRSDIVGDELSIVGGKPTRKQLVDVLVKGAAQMAAQKQKRPGQVGAKAYSDLRKRGGRPTPARKPVRFRMGPDGVYAPSRLRYGLPPFPVGR